MVYYFAPWYITVNKETFDIPWAKLLEGLPSKAVCSDGCGELYASLEPRHLLFFSGGRLGLTLSCMHAAIYTL